jgi:hypothetical protein
MFLVGLFGYPDYASIVVKDVNARIRRAKQTLLPDAEVLHALFEYTVFYVTY